MPPFAPGLFSTTNACFNASLSFCASVRAQMSALPPATYGTTSRTGFAG
jgi:hypothetical protein